MRLGFRVLIVTISLLSVTSAVVQARNGASLGMGGSYTSIARGAEAIFWNPANLGFWEPGMPKYNLKCYSFSVSGGNNAFPLDMLNEYNGRFLDADAKQEILAKIPSGEGVVPSARANASVVALTYKNFGFALELDAAGDFSIPKEVFQLALFGFEDKLIEFAYDGNAVAVGKMTFAYGRPIAQNKVLKLPWIGEEIRFREITAGASVSYIFAGGFADMRKGFVSTGFNGPSSAGPNGLVLDTRSIFRTAEGGWGFGLDLGFSAVTESDWMLGLAIDNFLSRVSWNDDAEETVVDISLPPGTYIWQDNSELDLDDYGQSETRKISSFSAGLPRDFRIGVAKKLEGDRWLPGVELARENSRYRFTAGSRYAALSWMDLFAGVGFKTGGIFYSGGVAFSFNRYYLDFGARSRGALAGNGTKGIAIANSFSFTF
ncbi:hypothetical protein ACFL4X_01745 [Gemmatimonadota bacterium]